MIEKIIARLREEKNKDRSKVYSPVQCDAISFTFGSAIDIVQEVAKEYSHRNSDLAIDASHSNGWIPVTYHVATDEEREEMCLSHDIAYILDCPMPDDEQEIIVCNERYVWTDTCMIDEGYSLDSGNDWCGDVVAWMQMPKKYEPKDAPYQKGEPHE